MISDNAEKIIEVISNEYDNSCDENDWIGGKQF